MPERVAYVLTPQEYQRLRDLMRRDMERYVCACLAHPPAVAPVPGGQASQFARVLHDKKHYHDGTEASMGNPLGEFYPARLIAWQPPEDVTEGHPSAWFDDVPDGSGDIWVFDARGKNLQPGETYLIRRVGVYRNPEPEEEGKRREGLLVYAAEALTPIASGNPICVTEDVTVGCDLDESGSPRVREVVTRVKLGIEAFGVWLPVQELPAEWRALNDPDADPPPDPEPPCDGDESGSGGSGGGE